MECFECGRKFSGEPPVLVKFEEGSDKAISGGIERAFCAAACAAEHLQNVVEDNASIEARSSRR